MTEQFDCVESSQWLGFTFFQILMSNYDLPFEKKFHVISYRVFFKTILKIKQRPDVFEKPGLLDNLILIELKFWDLWMGWVHFKPLK